MIKLFWICFFTSILGRLIKTVFRLPFVFIGSINDYLSYCESIWHYDSPKLIKTLYYNFRLCDFRLAVKMPIYVYGKTKTWSLSGKVKIISDKITSGMIKWGYDWGYRSNGITIIRIEGEVIFHGSCILAKASDIAVFNGASMSIGMGAEILENTIIYCSDSITIGDNFSFTFQSSMFDTDFHYILNINDRRIHRRSVPIIIGNNVWVGNRATIKKGVVIPDNTTIAASYTVLTKDYSDIPPFSILGGCPAKLLASGYSRIWKDEMSNISKFDNYFKEHDNNYYEVENNSISDYIYGCQ